MKYVDTEVIARQFGKILPFSIDYFARHVEKTLENINIDTVHPELVGAADVLRRPVEFTT